MTPRPSPSATAATWRRSAARSSARSSSRTYGRLFVSTTDRCNSAPNRSGGSCARSPSARGINLRVPRSTVWNSSSTPTATNPARSATHRGYVRGVTPVSPSVFEFRAQASADGVEVANHLGVGGQQARFVVRDAVLGAEGADERLNAAQARPRHGGEQVVLDLVVQPAEDQVG